MPETNLPDTLLKIGLALAKHHIKNVIGDEALEIAASMLTDVGGEKIQAKIDSIFASKEGQKELLEAAKAADERFKEKSKDNDLRQLFTMDYGNLPSVQKAIASLPEALDDDTLRETLFTAFRNDAPKRISDEQIYEGVSLYVECLQSALLPVEDFGQRIIHNALKEIGKDVKDIKADVKSLLEKTKANSQAATTLQKSYAHFLVPFPHNPDFVGRETELSSLHEMLQQGQSIVGIRPTVLVGLGGIGKTQLAVEYAHAYRADYPSGIFWLNAINPLLIEFSDLAEKLEMSDRDTPRDKAARKAWDYLDSHHDALVIFDNVLEPSELNVPFSPDLVPANLRCRTLFTTRQRDFPRTFQPFEVKVLPEMAAMRLLLRSRPEVLEEHHPEWGWARIVCAYLGWLPLALELAAAYLGAYPEVSITGYLERLRTEGSLETVDESEVRAVDLPTRVEEILKAAAEGNLEIKHQVAVSATLRTQWNRLDDEDAKLLFRAAGQFPEASWIPIPRLGLLTGIESEAKPGRPSPLNVMLKNLHAVSLIEELSDDRLRLHPLVQEFAARLSPTPASIRLEMAERVAAEFNDLLRLQARVTHYGIDIALEDIRTALGFCMDKPETKTYSYISMMERVLDRQAHALRGWNVQEKPAFFLQQIRQIRNEAFAQNLNRWQAQAEAELVHLKNPYLFERFPMSSDLAELRSLVGHSKKVRDIALSADGRLAISASEDNTLKVWDIPTGRELRTLIGHSNYVHDVALSADGRLAVSASLDKTLKVWDVPTGRELRTLQINCSHITLSANGQIVLFLPSDHTHTIKVWDIQTGCELRTLAGHGDTGNSAIHLALSGDGRLAISASNWDNTLKVWDVSAGQELLSFDTDNLGCIALSADGRLAISASNGDRSLNVWDIQTGRELRTFEGRHSSSIWDIALSADGRLAVTASSDLTLKVWDVPTGRELHTLRGHSEMVHDVALSADGRLAISASNNILKVWDISAVFALETVEGHSVSGSSGRELFTSTGHTGGVYGIALSADGQLAVSASADFTLKVWDVPAGRELHTLRGHNGVVYDVALSADGRVAVSADGDALKVWFPRKGAELRTLVVNNSINVALSGDGRLAVSTSSLGLDTLWEISARFMAAGITGRKLRTFHRDRSSSAVSVALSSDKRLVVFGTTDNTLRVWDVRRGRELRKLTGHSDWVSGIALSADARLAVSASKDNTLKVWDLPKGQELRTLSGHSGIVHDVALSTDDRLAVSVSDDQTLKVWDVATGSCITTLQIGVLLKCCDMSADGKTIVVGDNRGGVHFLEMVGADNFQMLVKEEHEEVETRSSWLPLWLKRLLG